MSGCQNGCFTFGFMSQPRDLWFIYFFFLVDSIAFWLNFVFMNKVKRYLFILTLVITGIVSGMDANAQCPMCKMSAESNLKNGGTAGRGLNTGILYMLALPYTLIGTFGYIWWRNNRRKEED